MFKSLLCMLLLLLPGYVQALSISSIGPSVHIHFSKKKIWPSLGFEYSYWVFPFGWDVGLELEATRLRLYSEAQFGFLGGFSFGPVGEIVWNKINESDSRVMFGSQASLWGVFGEDVFDGGVIDLRYRDIGLRNTFGLGLFGKIGTCYSRCEL